MAGWETTQNSLPALKKRPACRPMWFQQKEKQWLYPSYFKLQVRWLRSLTRITYYSKLIGIHSLAAFLQPELFRVNSGNDHLGEIYSA